MKQYIVSFPGVPASEAQWLYDLLMQQPMSRAEPFVLQMRAQFEAQNNPPKENKDEAS